MLLGDKRICMALFLVVGHVLLRLSSPAFFSLPPSFYVIPSHKNEAFFQRLSCLEMNIWICICWNWFIPAARKCSLLQGGDLQLPGAASKAGDAGRIKRVGKVPTGRTDSQLPPGSFWAQSTPWVVHRSYFTLGTYPAFGNWHAKGVCADARCENSRQHVMALAAGKLGSPDW